MNLQVFCLCNDFFFSNFFCILLFGLIINTVMLSFVAEKEAICNFLVIHAVFFLCIVLFFILLHLTIVPEKKPSSLIVSVQIIKKAFK